MSIDQLTYLTIATVAQTAVIIWGLKLLSGVLNREIGNDGETFGMQVLAEKNRAPGDDGDQDKSGSGSFSRIAGAIGALALAAFFAGVSYWALHALFADGELSKLQDLSQFFLVGSALFAPYAFNQIRGIFQ